MTALHPLIITLDCFQNMEALSLFDIWKYFFFLYLVFGGNSWRKSLSNSDCAFNVLDHHFMKTENWMTGSMVWDHVVREGS